MPLFRTDHARSLPPIFGVVLAFISLGIAAILIIGIESTSSGLLKQLSIAQLDQTEILHEKNSSGDESSLISALVDPLAAPFGYLAKLIRGETDQLDQRDNILEPVRMLNDLLIHLTQRRIKLALNLARKLIPDNSPLLRELEQAHELLERLVHGLEQAAQASSQLEIYTEELEFFSKKSLNLRERYNLLADRFAAVLSLEPIYALQEELTSYQLPTYQRGVLKGLPSLESLPDDIKDLGELSKIITSLGGKVTVEGVNQNLAFNTLLQELEASCQELVDEFSDISASMQTISTGITTVSSLLSSYINESETIVNQILSLVISEQLAQSSSETSIAERLKQSVNLDLKSLSKFLTELVYSVKKQDPNKSPDEDKDQLQQWD